MPSFEVFIPAAEETGFDLTFRVDADHWMAALKTGLDQVGLQGHRGNLLCDIKESSYARAEQDGRVHLYRAALAQEETQRHLVRDLLDRAFGGSPSQLVMQALAARPASTAELKEIRSLLKQYEEKDRG